LGIEAAGGTASLRLGRPERPTVRALTRLADHFPMKFGEKTHELGPGA
jgi:hypothetical protein